MTHSLVGETDVWKSQCKVIRISLDHISPCVLEIVSWADATWRNSGRNWLRLLLSYFVSTQWPHFIASEKQDFVALFSSLVHISSQYILLESQEFAPFAWAEEDWSLLYCSRASDSFSFDLVYNFVPSILPSLPLQFSSPSSPFLFMVFHT